MSKPLHIDRRHWERIQIDPTPAEIAEIEARYREVCEWKFCDEMPEPNLGLRYGKTVTEPVSFGGARRAGFTIGHSDF